MVEPDVSADDKAAHVLEGASLLEPRDGIEKLKRDGRESRPSRAQEVEEAAVP